MFRRKKLQPEQQLLLKETKNKKVFIYRTPRIAVRRFGVFDDRLNMNEKEINIKFIVDNKEICVKTTGGCTLSEIMQENNLLLSKICNGNGTCGKCKIRVLSGYLPITEADRRILSEQELRQGIRLGCKVILEKNMEEELCIEVLSESEEDIVVEGVSKTCNSQIYSEIINTEGEKDKDTIKVPNYFIAIDIGTTTIAMVLINEENGEICDIFTTLNHQREYGSDVLSRITAANNGKAELLKNCIENDLWRGIARLIQKENKDLAETSLKDNKKVNEVVSGVSISRIVIAANTTMIHLLMGYSCYSLGKYPFISNHLGQIECTLKECIGAGMNTEQYLERYANIPVTILPGISAFVGGDIVSGISSCLGFETEEINLLVDLGTNGEMVLGNKDRLLVTSTAAGPAFEGGNILCGVASVPGGICQMKMQNHRPIIKTIQNQLPPLGICGSGLVSAVAQLIRNGIINKEGVLKRPYFEQGFSLWTFENREKIALYQKDIREFQMAKSAVRASIEILMDEYGCNAEKITHVYLAGGLGVNLTEEDAIITEILPEEFKGKTEYIGNGSLKGAIQYGIEKVNKNIMQCENAGAVCNTAKKVQHIVQKSRYISLAENSKFQEMYLKYMGF